MGTLYGNLKMIKDREDIGEKGFSKRDFVVITEEQYPQHIPLQFTNDKCDFLDNFKIGESVKVEYNLNGREWTNPKGESIHFLTLNAWKIEKH